MKGEHAAAFHLSDMKHAAIPGSFFPNQDSSVTTFLNKQARSRDLFCS